MDYEKHIIEPTYSNPETSINRVSVTPEINNFVDENINALSSVIKILSGNEIDHSDPIFNRYQEKLKTDMAKIAEGLAMQNNDETITLDWSTLSNTEKQEIFYAHTKALGRVLEVIRNTKALPELTRTDVDRVIFGKTIDELAECWQLAQQDLLISPNDVLRIFTRYRDSKQAIEYLINAHTFAKDEGLSEFESRELFIRSGISDYEQIVYEYKKTKIEIQEAGMPTLWGEVIALRSGKEYVDQNLIKAGLMPSQRENKNRRA